MQLLDNMQLLHTPTFFILAIVTAVNTQPSLTRTSMLLGLGIDSGVTAPECGNNCTSLQNAIAACPAADISCVCTESFDLSMVTCINCLISTIRGDPEAVGAVQADVNQYVSQCKGSGNPVTAYQVSQVAATPNPSPSVKPSAASAARSIQHLWALIASTVIWAGVSSIA